VVPEDLEQKYITSPFIERICVHADRLQDALVCVIIPNAKSFLDLFGVKIEVILFDRMTLISFSYTSVRTHQPRTWAKSRRSYSQS